VGCSGHSRLRVRFRRPSLVGGAISVAVAAAADLDASQGNESTRVTPERVIAAATAVAPEQNFMRATIEAKAPPRVTLDAEPYPAARYGALTREIGRGAFGAVYRAKDAKDAKGGEVAIKVIPKDKANEAEIANEAAILKQLSAGGCRPLLLCYVALYQDKANYYLVSEYIAAPFQTLETLIRSFQGRPPSVGVGWLAPAARNLVMGLKQIHAAGVAHRDIKPANILVNPTSGLVKIIDFGVGCRRDPATGRDECPPSSAEIAGTLDYMAP
jgi:hypothetical protein